MIFTTEDLNEKNELVKTLSFDVSTTVDEDLFDEDDKPDSKMFITFYGKDGCLLDHDPITYLFQDILPEEFMNEIDGVYSYNGDLSIEEIRNLLESIFKK